MMGLMEPFVVKVYEVTSVNKVAEKYFFFLTHMMNCFEWLEYRLCKRG